MPHADDHLMLNLLRAALRRYKAALLGATPMQKFVWQNDRRIFVVGAPSFHAASIISLAMVRHLHKGQPLPKALRTARAAMQPYRHVAERMERRRATK